MYTLISEKVFETYNSAIEAMSSYFFLKVLGQEACVLDPDGNLIAGR